MNKIFLLACTFGFLLSCELPTESEKQNNTYVFGSIRNSHLSEASWDVGIQLYEIVPINDQHSNQVDIANASVSANGQTLSNYPGSPLYSDTLNTLPSGSSVDLQISTGLVEISETIALPELINVTIPANNDQTILHDVSTDLEIQWDVLSPSPDYIAIWLSDFETANGESFHLLLPGSATSCVIPGNTLIDSDIVRIPIEAINEISIEGNLIDTRSVLQAVSIDHVSIDGRSSSP